MCVEGEGGPREPGTHTRGRQSKRRPVRFRQSALLSHLRVQRDHGCSASRARSAPGAHARCPPPPPTYLHRAREAHAPLGGVVAPRGAHVQAQEDHAQKQSQRVRAQRHGLAATWSSPRHGSSAARSILLVATHKGRRHCPPVGAGQSVWCSSSRKRILTHVLLHAQQIACAARRRARQSPHRAAAAGRSRAPGGGHAQGGATARARGAAAGCLLAVSRAETGGRLLGTRRAPSPPPPPPWRASGGEHACMCVWRPTHRAVGHMACGCPVFKSSR